MKKLAIFLIVFGVLATHCAAFSITDPFYMPEKGQIMGDLAVALTNEDARFDESFAFKGLVQVGLRDNLVLGLAFGWANIRHHSRGLIDPTISVQYRFKEGFIDGYYLDLDAFLSPQSFDSWQSDKGGAKGATDFGATLKIGSTELVNNFTLYTGVSAICYGHSKFVHSGTGLTVLAGAKYYLDETNSFDLSFNLSNYFNFMRDHIGAGFDINYSRELTPNKLALIIYYGAERHNKHIVSYNHWGVKWRYLF